MAKVDLTQFHFSATIHTPRREVLYALRALSMAAQQSINNKIPWSGVTDDSWRKRHHQATFYFSSIKFRTQFLEWATELIPSNTWTHVGDSDEHTVHD